MSWNKYSISRYIFSGFLVKLEIDNFKSDRPDYVSVSITANLVDGGRWVGKHFVFEGKAKDEEFRIAAHTPEKVTVLVFDDQAHRSERKPMPEIDKKTLKIEVSTRGGGKFFMPLEESQVTEG